MTADQYFKVSDADIGAYQEDGVVCLRGVLGQAWIDELREGVEDVLRNPGPRASVDASAGGKYIYDTFMWTRHETFRHLHEASPLPRIAAQLMGSSKSHFMVDTLFVKEPMTPRPVPWHQDQPVGWYEGHQVISVWIPLDTVTLETGALEYVRASHRDGQWYAMPVEALRDDDEKRGRKPRPDVEAAREDFDIIHFDTEPGDVLFHHLLMLHGSRGNDASNSRRRALALRYTGDDATYAPRPGGLAPMWDPGIAPGDRFGCDLFPQVWPPAAGLRRFWKDPAPTST